MHCGNPSPIPPHGTWEFLGTELMSSGLAPKAFTGPRMCISLFSFFLCTLKIEPRGLHMLGNCSTI